MKIYFPVILLPLLLYACGAGNQPTGKANEGQPVGYKDSPMVEDTAKINAIDKEWRVLDNFRRYKPKLIYIDSQLVGNNDFIVGYFDVPENGLTSLYVSEKEMGVVNVNYILCKNDQPIRLQHRYWDTTITPQTTEEMLIYFDEAGDLFYACERGAILAEGEKPAVMKSIELEQSEKSKKELYDYFMKRWQLGKPAMDKDRALKSSNMQTQ